MANAAVFIASSQNPDGGWGYRVGGMSFVEPTATVLQALNSDAAAARQRACDWLLALQHADGGWGIGAPDSESGWMTAHAVLALAGWHQAQTACSRGVDWLLATEGIRATDPAAREQVRSAFRMDSTLRGWPWQPGDAAWVHPTAIALLALCAADQAGHARVKAGVDYILDRAVAGGGWNIGNPEMLGKIIPANAQDTAVALVALKAAGMAGEARVDAGIQFLQTAVRDARTSAELAWGVYGLSKWGVSQNGTLRLSALQRSDGSWDGNPFITAIAIQAGLE